MSGELGGGEGALVVVEAPVVKAVEKVPILPLQSKSEVPRVEKTDDQRFLEDSKNFGDYHVSFIRSLAGQGQPDGESFDRLPLELKAEAATMATSAKRQFIEQALRAADAKMDARAMLAQVYKGPQFDELLVDPSKYRLEQLSDGVYVVYVDMDLMSKLRPGAAAGAVMPTDPEGVAFLMVRDSTDQKGVGQLDENIPHELQHIAWRFMQKDGLVDIAETDPLLAQGYKTFQDELLAKLASDGSLSSYDYLRLITPSQREALEKERPESVRLLKQTTIKLNEAMREFRDKLPDSGLVKSDLILGTIQARTFAELEANLIRIRNIASQNPKVESEDTQSAQAGWETV